MMIRITSAAAILSVSFLASPAFAQENSSGTTPATTQSAPVASQNSDVGGVPAGATQSQSGSVTRAEVKQQLVVAVRDGELAHLNATLYRGQ
jgi:hypothetical protein